MNSRLTQLVEHLVVSQRIISSSLIAAALLCACNPRELTQEEKWVQDQDRKCIAAKSRGTYIRETKIYECWNKPAFRRPKKVFEEGYLP